MGLNTENFFVRSTDGESVATAIAEYLRPGFSAEPPSAWPLEVTSSLTAAGHARKISISDPKDGWVAVVESSEVVEPGLAVFLAERLATRVAVIQIYEVTGSCGVALLEDGTATGGPTRHDVDDPMSAVSSFLRKNGVSFEPALFRETVGRHRNVGWRTLVGR